MLDRSNCHKFIVAIVLCLISSRLVMAVDPPLTKDQMKQFLGSAKVVASKHTNKGVTDPWRLTLTMERRLTKACFRRSTFIKRRCNLPTARPKSISSTRINTTLRRIRSAELLGMDDMIPVYVERKWNGQVGSISWLVSVKFDEQDRLKQKISSPDTDAWNKQMYKIRVFDELVYDNDPNLTNVLIGEDWKIWRVDFSRAFRLSKDVKSNPNLVRCDRQLFEKLKTLNEADVLAKTKNYLTKPEVQAVMARRDKIVAYFQKLIAQKGESEILY